MLSSCQAVLSSKIIVFQFVNVFVRRCIPSLMLNFYKRKASDDYTGSRDDLNTRELLK